MTENYYWDHRSKKLVIRDETRFIGLFKIPTEKQIGRAKARKVDFVIAGAAKGGTTALDAYLRFNPEICMPQKIKEIHFSTLTSCSVRASRITGYTTPSSSRRRLIAF